MTVCYGNSTILSSSMPCNINWFDNSTGGNLLGTGPNLNTSTLSSTTTFYIEDPSCGITSTRTAVQVTVVPLPVINIITNNPLICIGQSSTLTASGANSYTWSPSMTLNSTIEFSVIATPVVNTVYTVTGSNGSCSGTNSIPIQLVPQPAPLITANDFKVCNGSTLALNASGAQTYSWLPSNILSNSNGSTTIASPTSATNFTLIGVNTVGMVSCLQQTTYSVIVLQYTQPVISNNVVICEGENAVLTVSGGNIYNWTPNIGLANPNDFGIVVSPTTTSVYSVNVSNNGYCGTTATVLVNVNPKPSVYAGRDTVFNLKEPMMITAVGEGTLKWIFGDDISCKDCPSTQIFPIKNSCYVVEAINSFGCRATDEVCIDVSRENVIYIPNTFTPDGDGLNDEFYISGFGFSDITIEIFDRWGEKLFISNDVTKGWNGKFQGKDCKEDTYIYKLSYKTFGSKLTTTAGHVNLIK
jgi:gliding motility-associated-like protein